MKINFKHLHDRGLFGGSSNKAAVFHAKIKYINDDIIIIIFFVVIHCQHRPSLRRMPPFQEAHRCHVR